MLFNIFVGSMDSGVKCTLSKFADDNRLCSDIDRLEGRDANQRDLIMGWKQPHREGLGGISG